MSTQTVTRSIKPRTSQDVGLTRTRLQLEIPAQYHEQPIVSRLISEYQVVVNITRANLGFHTQGKGSFDLELQGTPSQISKALAYLQSLRVRVIGKPSTAGDSWNY